MRVHLAIISFAVLLTLNLTGAPHRSTDDVPLRNWPVAFDRYVHTAPPASGKFQSTTNALPSGPAAFVAVTPCRLVDTRNPNGLFGGPIFQAGDTRSYNIPAASVAAACSVPAAVAYSLNFTIANYSGRSNLKAYPTGTTPPLVSTLNYGSGLPLGNAAIVPADAAGSIDVAIALTTTPGPTNVIIDINGYVADGVVTKLTAGTGLTVTGTNDVTVAIDATVQRTISVACAPPSSLNFISGDGNATCVSPPTPRSYGTGSYSLTVPAGITELLIEAWGAGGGGGGAHISNGGGGGGGGYMRARLPVTPGEALAVVVGAGGLGGANGATGQTGGTTSISRLLIMSGGAGGQTDNGGGSGGQVTIFGVATVFEMAVGGTGGADITGGVSGRDVLFGRSAGGNLALGGRGGLFPGGGQTGGDGLILMTFLQ